MPSRAVVRKKARREAKREKAAASPACRPGVYYNGNTSEPRRVTPVTGRSQEDGRATVVPARFQVQPPPKRVPRGTPRVFVKPPPTSSAAEPLDGKEVLAHKQHELSAGTANEGVAEDTNRFTHRQRKKLEAKLRLERQMSRLQENAARAAARTAAAGQTTETTSAVVVAAATTSPVLRKGGNSDEEKSATDAPATALAPIATEGPKERHDPRFTNGTFWRDRKEKRSRTLFLGGIPSHFTEQHVKDFVATVVDADPGSVDYLAQLEPGTPIVEAIDVLKSKLSGKVQHMYITMASVPIAFIASTKLDGMRMDQRTLRCNFAADKSQRAEAIRRRGPEEARDRRFDSHERGRGGRGGCGRRGGGRGFRGGVCRGLGRGEGGHSSWGSRAPVHSSSE